LTRNVAHVESVLFAHIAYVLTHPRAYELLAPPPPDVDAEALHAEKKAIRTRLDKMAEDEVMGLKTRAQVIAATKRANARVEEIDELLNMTVSGDPLADLLSGEDPVKEWMGTLIADQRVIVDRLFTVTIMPSRRRGRGFDPTTVRVDAKQPLGAA
jgi:hypothetical protein